MKQKNKAKITLVILAMEEELNGLLNNINDYEEVIIDNLKCYLYKHNDVDYLITLGRIGKASTAFYLGKLCERYDVKRIINVGTSGGLNNNLSVGDIIIANGVIYHDVDVTSFGYEMNQMAQCKKIFIPDEEFINSKINDELTLKFSLKRGLIASGDSFINQHNFNRLDDFIKSKCLAIEMESGSVAQCASMCNIPFVIIRSISDIVVRENNNQDFDNNLNEVCHKTGKFVAKIL